MSMHERLAKQELRVLWINREPLRANIERSPRITDHLMHPAGIKRE
jgi:hypothetical protein